MNNQFEKLIEDARKVSLSYDEKDLIRHALKKRIGLINESPVFGGFRFFSFKFVATALGAIVIISTSISYAAESALPGSPLYIVKNFNEKLSSLLILTPEKSAEWQVELADRRLEETQKLNGVGKLDEDKRTALEFKFETNANQFNKEIKTLKSENKLKQAGELTGKLESIIEKRKKIFSDMASEENMSDHSEINVILNKVNLRSEQVMGQRQEIEDALAEDDDVADTKTKPQQLEESPGNSEKRTKDSLLKLEIIQ